MNTSKITSLKVILLTVLAAMTLSACSLPWPPPPRVGHVAQSQIDTQRAIWLARKPARYRFEAELMCFCAEPARKPVTFEVNGDTAVAMRYADGGEIPADMKDVFSQHSSIDKLFALLQDAADRHASAIDVTYDDSLGYPTQISIDYDSQMADEERRFVIRNVQAF